MTAAAASAATTACPDDRKFVHLRSHCCYGRLRLLISEGRAALTDVTARAGGARAAAGPSSWRANFAFFFFFPRVDLSVEGLGRFGNRNKKKENRLCGMCTSSFHVGNRSGGELN